MWYSIKFHLPLCIYLTITLDNYVLVQWTQHGQYTGLCAVPNLKHVIYFKEMSHTVSLPTRILVNKCGRL